MQPDTSIPGTDNACGAPGLSDAHNGHQAPCALPWYALRVRSNHERTVAKLLTLACVESFLPVYSEASRWSDRTKTVERVLFPGYIFVRVPADKLAPVLQIAGVCGVLGGHWTPAEIAESELDAIRKVLASMLPVTPAEYFGTLHPGDLVTVRSGALKGVSGRILKHAKGLRLVVSIEMLGRACSVEVDSESLSKELAAAA